jgi:Uma2 family endonuclease
MGQAPTREMLGIHDFLAWDAQQSERSELVGGVVYAMAGADSLQEYLLVDLDTRRSDVYRKGADGLWVLHPHDPGSPVLLTSVDLALPAERLFAEVDD